MTFFGIQGILAILAAVALTAPVSAAEANSTPDFKEVYELLRAHSAELGDANVNRAAVDALLSSLAPKVALVTNSADSSANNDNSVLSKPGVFETNLAYLRIARVTSSLPTALRQSFDQLARTNKLKGLVLDLRFAVGDDYQAAADTADLFVSKETTMLNWGNGQAKSKSKSDAITIPVAILVNHQTAAAAEALAAVIRQVGGGLILGSRTAGQALVAKDYPLKSGESLRIASAPIKLGDGTSLTSAGLAPDIAVNVPAAEERAYYADAFKVLPRPNLQESANLTLTNSSSNSTNRSNRRPRFNEAELVRERREGAIRDTDSLTPSRELDLDKPVVFDPVLARALDLLKGLALVRQSRS